MDSGQFQVLSYSIMATVFMCTALAAFVRWTANRTAAETKAAAENAAVIAKQVADSAIEAARTAAETKAAAENAVVIAKQVADSAIQAAHQISLALRDLNTKFDTLAITDHVPRLIFTNFQAETVRALSEMRYEQGKNTAHIEDLMRGGHHDFREHDGG